MGGEYSKPREVASKYYVEYTSKLPSLAGKVAAITGTTSGTGLVCAKTLAKQGAHVLLLNRASERSVTSEKEILESVPGAKVSSIECDLQSFESVKKAAVSIKDKFGSTGIDILCNNAGVMALADCATPDGYDVQMQTNHLSHFLLTRELFPLLEKAAERSGEARIVQHSSGARKYPAGDLGAQYLGKNGGNLGGDGASMFFGGSRWQRYHQTKLANALFTTSLTDKLTARGSKVKALCATPGLSATNLQVTSNKAGGFLSTWIMFLVRSFCDLLFLPFLSLSHFTPPPPPAPTFYQRHKVLRTVHSPSSHAAQAQRRMGGNCGSLLPPFGDPPKSFLLIPPFAPLSPKKHYYGWRVRRQWGPGHCKGDVGRSPSDVGVS